MTKHSWRSKYKLLTLDSVVVTFLCGVESWPPVGPSVTDPPGVLGPVSLTRLTTTPSVVTSGTLCRWVSTIDSYYFLSVYGSRVMVCVRFPFLHPSSFLTFECLLPLYTSFLETPSIRIISLVLGGYKTPYILYYLSLRILVYWIGPLRILSVKP